MPREYLTSSDESANDQIDAFLEDKQIDPSFPHNKLNSFFEHGQWWATCNLCGASWSIVDSEPGPLDLEEIDFGDESCLF